MAARVRRREAAAGTAEAVSGASSRVRRGPLNAREMAPARYVRAVTVKVNMTW